ncbi:MAG: putative maltokinase, partial [Bauldia sp.]
WHRFYSHQPDLNFDNPKVLEAVIDTMYFWLDMGVDGLRLDAIPYLVERDGTNNENIPETHAVIKKIRAALDRRYTDRMLLAEANQWPEDTAEYFGKGDECHMAFHFPLMPRMYMALAQEDRHPITDILRQTPEIPEGTQWAVFLRNHDELTLEMVTSKERDYLWSFYAAERRARINLGIRRRLAPLLENDRRKIELLNSLVLSMPGTPILYYGDEIGMGDNIYLGDRDGVRTPMQWSPDRSGGFSKADPARLFLPAIQDPIYGFDSVNVEAQQRTPSSLLSWERRMLAIRRNLKVFGRGTLRFLLPSNRKVLAYIRELGDERVLCVANVSRAPQAVELDLSEFRGMVPTEMTGGEMFPVVGDGSYQLTLSAYGFYWFSLTPAASKAMTPVQPELFTLVLSKQLSSVLSGREKTAFERTIAPGYIAAQRWFAGKKDRIASTALDDFAVLDTVAGTEGYLLPTVSVTLRGGAKQSYFIPVAYKDSEDDSLLPAAIARARRGARTGLLYGAADAPDFALSVVAAIRGDRTLQTASGGVIRFEATPALPEQVSVDPAEVKRLGVEQSNTSIALGKAMMLKLFRVLKPGIHPDIEMGRYLTEVARFPNVPAALGSVELIAADGRPTALAFLQAFVPNQGDAATLAIDELKRDLDHEIVATPADVTTESQDRFLAYATIIGRRIGEMHAALARPTDDPFFAPEPIGADHMTAQLAASAAVADQAFAALASVPAGSNDAADALRPRRNDVVGLLGALAATPADAKRMRVHGDLHLGQVLIAKDDVVIVDFEGEPGKSTEARRTKDTPLRDVAGMLRSFAYAADTATQSIAQRFADKAGAAADYSANWRKTVETAFMGAYEVAAGGTDAWVADAGDRSRLLRFHLLTRALYEIVYEANNRPDWIGTPARGVIEILEAKD